jgi:acetyl/propionyl-CoA carboxylase alpha subunit
MSAALRFAPADRAHQGAAREIEAFDRGDGGVVVDGTTFDVSSAGPERWLVAGPDGRTVVHVAWDGATCWVHADGRAWRLARSEGTRRNTTATDDEVALASPMPASVRAVHVQAGQAVTRGDVLVVLEAMKMELPIRAPRDAVVAHVRCSVGDLVQPGLQLVELA